MQQIKRRMKQTNEPGDCYEAAARYVLDHRDTILVHGQPRLLREPYTRFGHAWVEVGQTAIDVANGNHVELPAPVYYSLGHIDSQQCRRYSFPEVRRWILQTGHWGPWQ